MKFIKAFFVIMCLGAIYGLYKIPQIVTEMYTCKLLMIICGLVVFLCVTGMLIIIDAEAISEEPTERLEELECTKNPN